MMVDEGPAGPSGLPTDCGKAVAEPIIKSDAATAVLSKFACVIIRRFGSPWLQNYCNV